MTSFMEACHTFLTSIAATVSEGMFTTFDFKPPHVSQCLCFPTRTTCTIQPSARHPRADFNTLVLGLLKSLYLPFLPSKARPEAESGTLQAIKHAEAFLTEILDRRSHPRICVEQAQAALSDSSAHVRHPDLPPRPAHLYSSLSTDQATQLTLAPARVDERLTHAA